MTDTDFEAINPIDESVSWDEAYEGVVHNDSVTPLEFVVELLMSHFLILQHEALQIALRVHSGGRSGIGRLSKEVAERVRDSMVSKSCADGQPLRVEGSKWSAAPTD